jgi:hypothetical protein
MATLPELIREYREVQAQELELAERKTALREQILAALAAQKLRYFVAPQGVAICAQRFKLTPRREPVLALLTAEDLFPFSRFTGTRVKELLVPKYGREKLLPLFDISTIQALVVKTPAQAV